MPEYPSFAKINIGLHILRKRDDGYHDIETTFKLVDLRDRVYIEPATEPVSKLTTNNDKLPLDESNLAFKAVRLLEAYAGRPLPVSIHLEKKIPIGAGLGGGSSNAATVLFAITQMFDLKLPQSDLMSLASKLGSDVPFFTGCHLAMGNTAFGSGRGERLEFFDWNLNETVVLVYPKVPISTAWAYQNYNKYKDLNAVGKAKNTLTNRGVSAILSAPLAKKTFFDNDFEPLVFAEHDKIRLQRQLMTDYGAIFSSLSGSGSTVFGLFDSLKISDASSLQFPDCDVFVSNFV